MKPRALSLLFLVPLLLVLAAFWTGVPVAAQGPYTIRGTVVYPDGRPAPGIELMLYPHSGQALDKGNTQWKIPNYDYHPVKTDARGEFVMTNVIDYQENKIHRYIVYVVGPTKFYHATVHVVLGGEKLERRVTVELTKATVLRFKLKDRGGKPFSGKRAVYVQSGVLGQGVTKGVSYVTEVEFVNGVGEFGPVVLKDQVGFRGRVAVLDFPSQKFAHAAMRERGMPLGDSEQPLRWVMKDARGRSLDRSTRFTPGGVTEVEFSLD